MLMSPPPVSCSSSESYSMLISKHLGERQLARPGSGSGARPRGHFLEGAGRALPPASGGALGPSAAAGPPLSRAGPGARPGAWDPPPPLLRSRLQCSRGSGDRLRPGGFSGEPLPFLQLLPPTSPSGSSGRSPALQGWGDEAQRPGPRGRAPSQPRPGGRGAGGPGSLDADPAPGPFSSFTASPASASSSSSSSSSASSSSSSSSGMLNSFLLRKCWRGGSRICSKISSSLSVSQKGSGWGWGSGGGRREERSVGKGQSCDLCPQRRAGVSGNPKPGPPTPVASLQEARPERVWPRVTQRVQGRATGSTKEPAQELGAQRG